MSSRPPLKPFHLIGSWVVEDIKADPRTIGVDRGSKFDIIPADATNLLLVPTLDVAWNTNGVTPTIPLAALPPKHPDREQGMLVGGIVELGGQIYQLVLGPRENSEKLEFQLRSVDYQQAYAGGSGSAGRGT